MKKLLIFSIIAVFVYISAFAEYPRTDQTIAKYYNNARVVKVKYSQGDTYVSRSFDEGNEEAGVNLPIFEKDTVGTNDGRLDIYLGKSNFLRLDYDTEIEFQRIPELRKTNMRVFIRRGSIYLDIHNLDYSKDIELQTPDCGIFILNRGIYRINYNGARGTEVFVIEGLAEVAGENSSRSIMENQKIVMRRGSIHERPFYFYASDNDNFDQWNEERHSQISYARSSSSRYLDRGYEDYEYELSRSGRWRYSSTYNTNIWIPYNVRVGWRPYYNGRWVWTPSYGYYWYSYDPWDSFTYHYGRWHYDSFWGWHWLPGYRWSPAWVGWCYSGSYYGWTPLSRYNRPVIVINKRWLRNYDYRRGIPWRSQSSVFVEKGHMGRSIRKVALRKGSMLKNRKVRLSYSGISPSARINYNHIKVKNSRGKTVRFKKSGLRSPNFKSVTQKRRDGIKSRTIYKYRKSNSNGFSTYKKSGSAKRNQLGEFNRQRYKSKKISSSKVKKSSSSRYRTKAIKSSESRSGKKIKRKKQTGIPSFSYRRYSGSQNSGNYSSRSYGTRKSSGYKYGSSSRNTFRRYTSKTSGSSFSYKKKHYSSRISKPNYNRSRSYKSYRSYSPKKSIYGKKSYGVGNNSFKYSKPNYSKDSYKKSRSYSKPISRSKSYSGSYRSSRSSSRGISTRRSVRSSSGSSSSSSRSGKAKRK